MVLCNRLDRSEICLHGTKLLIVKHKKGLTLSRCLVPSRLAGALTVGAGVVKP